MTPHDPAAVIRRHQIAPQSAQAPVVTALSGARLTAADGAQWLDAATGGFGSGHPAVLAALREQAQRVALSSRILLSRPLARAVQALSDFVPDPLTVSYLCNSGAEALDSALKLAKGLHPERRGVLGIAGEDFGSLTHGQGLALAGSPVPGLPLRPYTVPAAEPNTLLSRLSPEVAAVVVAPAAPGRPLAKLSAHWWRALRRQCTQYDILLVLDERLTGPARLGHGLGSEALGIVPDAVVLGESLGADAVPVGVMVTSRATYDRVYAGRNPSLHGSTFGANPLSAVAVTAVLRALADDDLAGRQQHAEIAARHFLDGVADPAGPVREFCADGSLVWLRLADASVADALRAALAERRVLVRPASDGAPDVVPVLPPLTADPADVREIFRAVRSATDQLRSPVEVLA